MNTRPHTRIEFPHYNGGLDVSAFTFYLDHIEDIAGDRAIMILELGKWLGSGKPEDLKDQQVNISYFEAGDYQESPPLWVKASKLDALSKHQLTVHIVAHDIWAKLQTVKVRDVLPQGQLPEWRGDTTVFDILSCLLSGAITLILDSSDGVVDTLKPDYEAQLDDPVVKPIGELFALTNCRPRMRQDGLMHIFRVYKTASSENTFDIAKLGVKWQSSSDKPRSKGSLTLPAGSHAPRVWDRVEIIDSRRT